MGPIEPVTQGVDLALALTLRGRDGEPITTYTALAALEATVWAGGDRAPAALAVAEWIDPAAGSVRLGLSRDQTAGLAPGDYQVQIAITAGGSRAAATVLTLRVLPAPGSAPSPPAYCSYRDLQSIAPWIGDLLTADDQTGFAAQRAAARSWLDGVLLARLPGGQGGDLGLNRLSGSGLWGRDWAASRLAADALVLTGADGARLRRACALYAVAEVLQHQVGDRGGFDYPDLAGRFRYEAEALASSGWAWLDLDGDDRGDYPIELGTLRTARG